MVVDVGIQQWIVLAFVIIGGALAVFLPSATSRASRDGAGRTPEDYHRRKFDNDKDAELRRAKTRNQP